MSNTILVAGPDDLLAVHISALELARTSGSSICRITNRVPPEKFLRSVQEQYRGATSDRSAGSQLESRVRVIVSTRDSIDAILQGGIRAEKAWYLLPTRRNLTINSESWGRFVAALPQAGVRELNFVLPAFPGAPNQQDDGQQISVNGTIQQCQAQNIGWRIFQTSLIAGSVKGLPDDHDLAWFLSALHDLKREIGNRASDYFGFEALRLLASPEAALNLISAADASQLMTQIAARKDTINGVYDIAAPESIPFMDICEQIGSAYELGLLPVEDENELNAIDRLFMYRTEAFHQYLESLPDFASGKSYELAGRSSQEGILDQASQLEIFTAIRQKQDEEQQAQSKRIAALPEQLHQKTIHRNWFDLTYSSGGNTGIPILILNALGQGLAYWYPLLEQLIPEHRVLIWEPRGTLSPPPPFGLKDQVDDAESILREEGITKCHIIGWCTGPKLAVELYFRTPETIQSMVFLNSQFKCPGTPRSVVTAYEHNIDPLFRVLEKNPRTAPAVMNSLKTTIGGAINLAGQTDSKKLGTDVLSLMNQDLKGLVLAPFQSEESTANYAYQIIDFWSYDTLARAGEVKVPILMIAAEYDQVASPAMSREARHRFPQVTHVEVQGATHYLLYDRPGFVAKLIADFLEQPDSRIASLRT